MYMYTHVYAVYAFVHVYEYVWTPAAGSPGPRAPSPCWEFLKGPPLRVTFEHVV